MPMPMYNYDNAINILHDTYWVGFYDESADLHCNPYLLIDHGDVIFRKTMGKWGIDPGSNKITSPWSMRR